MEEIKAVKDKVAVVTGGASGIGQSCVIQLLIRSAKYVAIFDLPSTHANNVIQEMKQHYGNEYVDLFPCDVTSNEQVERSFKKILESHGGIDILINSAGIFNDVQWELMMNINIVGLTRVTLKAFDLMSKHRGGKGGTIVNIASIAGITPAKETPIYAATKYGVVGLTSSLALNYETTGIRMMMVCPGYTKTPLVDTTDFSERLLKFVSPVEVFKTMETQTMQPPESVAVGVARLIEKGENGAAMVITNLQPFHLVDIPTFTDLSQQRF